MDTRQLRKLILTYFDHDEFRIFVHDYFRPVYADIMTPGISQSIRVLMLIEHCEKSDAFVNLLNALQQERENLTSQINALHTQLPSNQQTTQPTNQPTTQPSNQQTIQPAHNSPKRDPRKIFISHATADAELAHRLADDLEAEGFPIWIAPDSIRAGEQWVEAISRGLEECGIFLLLLTPEAVKSKWVQRETNVAIGLEHEGEMQLLPLQVKPCRLPMLWRSYQRILWGSNFEEGWKNLAQTLLSRRANVSKGQTRTTIKKPAHKSAESKANRYSYTDQFSNSIINEKGYQEWMHEKTGITMIHVPAGLFLYGVEKEQIDLPEFLIGKTPVTNEQYSRFVTDVNRDPPKHWKGKKPSKLILHHPVTQISWHDAMAFVKWAELALPHEKQWEKAARGMNGYIYAWGNDLQDGYCNVYKSHIESTTPVGQFSPQGDSPYGCVDICGNVWEWCENWYGLEKIRRCLRGGAFNDYLRRLYTTFRVSEHPDTKDDGIGFRVVKNMSHSNF